MNHARGSRDLFCMDVRDSCGCVQRGQVDDKCMKMDEQDDFGSTWMVKMKICFFLEFTRKGNNF